MYVSLYRSVFGFSDIPHNSISLFKPVKMIRIAYASMLFNCYGSYSIEIIAWNLRDIFSGSQNQPSNSSSRSNTIFPGWNKPIWEALEDRTNQSQVQTSHNTTNVTAHQASPGSRGCLRFEVGLYAQRSQSPRFLRDILNERIPRL